MTVGGVVGTIAGLPLARRMGANAALGCALFAGLILIVAAYARCGRRWRSGPCGP